MPQPDTTSRWTVDQLAERSGMTVRNIRAHQSRGLLPPPEIVGRTGFYDDRHLRRLEIIQGLQARGLNLTAIDHILRSGQVVEALSAPFAEVHDPEDRVHDAQELIRLLRLEDDFESVHRCVQLGLLTMDGTTVTVSNPRLVSLAEQLVGLGLPVGAQLDALELLQAHTAEIATSLVDLAERSLIPELAASTGGDVEQLQFAVERLRSLADEGVTMLFNEALGRTIRARFEDLGG